MLGVIGNTIGTKFDYNSFDFLDSFRKNGLVRFGGINGTIGSSTFNQAFGLCRVTMSEGYVFQEVIVFGVVLTIFVRNGYGVTTWEAWKKVSISNA